MEFQIIKAYIELAEAELCRYYDLLDAIGELCADAIGDDDASARPMANYQRRRIEEIRRFAKGRDNYQIKAPKSTKVQSKKRRMV